MNNPCTSAFVGRCPPSSIDQQGKLVDWPELMAIREGMRERGQTLVWTNGCFDLLHLGHVYSLEQARRWGDRLVVGLNTDASIQRLKGPHRPIIPQAQRASLLCALSCVNHVVWLDETTPESALARLQPNVHCKGAEYAPPHGRPFPEGAIIDSYGGRIEFIEPLPDISTTIILRRIERLLAQSSPVHD